jgi:hypothetical protein
MQCSFCRQIYRRVLYLAYVTSKPLRAAPVLEELAATVLSIVRSCYVERGRYQASHTFHGGVRCSDFRQIDRRVLYLAYVTSKPLRAGPPHGHIGLLGSKCNHGPKYVTVPTKNERLRRTFRAPPSQRTLHSTQQR